MTNSGDKKLLFDGISHTSGADTLYDLGQATLFDNSTGQVNITLDSVSCTLSIIATGVSKHYYNFLFVTDPGGALPTGLSDCNDAGLSTWINTYRRQIWMTCGGYAKFNAAIPDEEKELVMEAGTKRTLRPGQKLILVSMTRNSQAQADSDYVKYDVNIFYHY